MVAILLVHALPLHGHDLRGVWFHNQKTDKGSVKQSITFKPKGRFSSMHIAVPSGSPVLGKLRLKSHHRYVNDGYGKYRLDGSTLIEDWDKQTLTDNGAPMKYRFHGQVKEAIEWIGPNEIRLSGQTFRR